MSEWMIEPCPFCGNTEVELICGYHDTDEHRTVWKEYDYFVRHAEYLKGNRTLRFECVCRNPGCGVDGPQRDTPKDAVAIWNTRKRRRRG